MGIAVKGRTKSVVPKARTGYAARPIENSSAGTIAKLGEAK